MVDVLGSEALKPEKPDILKSGNTEKRLKFISRLFK